MLDRGPRWVDSVAPDAPPFLAACNCSLAGSRPDGGFTCQNVTGQCECKDHVEGRDCGQCRDGFHNLTDTNPQGCSGQ